MDAAFPPATARRAGHPMGLAVLAFTEGCERFSFYGMQALLALYMLDFLQRPGAVQSVPGLGGLRAGITWLYGPQTTTSLAAQIFGLYTAGVYLTPVFGSLLADRWLGRTRAILAGCGLMVAGHFAMAFQAGFVVALLLLICGCGLVKGNIAAQVGGLYDDHDPLRTDAFQIFALAIAVGVIIAPLVCGTLGERIGYHVGFAAAGIGMLVSIFTYLAGRHSLPPEPARRRAGGKIRLIPTGVESDMSASPPAAGGFAPSTPTGVPPASQIGSPPICDAGGTPVGGAGGRSPPPAGGDADASISTPVGITRRDRNALVAQVTLTLILAVVFVGNDQIYGFYPVWARDHADLGVLGWKMPVTWLASLDSLVTTILLPITVVFWRGLARRGIVLHELTKITGAAVCAVMAPLFLAAACGLAARAGGRVTLPTLLLFHILNGIAFVNLYPVGLALVSRTAPAGLNATMVGVFYLLFVGTNLMVGWLGALYGRVPSATFWLLHAALVGVAAAVLLLLYRPMRRALA